METKLVILCEVCLTPPKIWSREMEKGLLNSYAIQCGHCKQMMRIPDELKRDIRKQFGMFN